MTDITELAQRNELLIANGQQTADLLRHMADNEIDSDYFAVVSECESYGKETDAELSITEFALRAAGYVDALIEALEKAQTINAAAEKLVRCKGRYHSEQNYRALAALFGVKTPDLPPLEHENVHYADAAEMEIAALRQRIAELEPFHTAYIEWSDKTAWVQTDKRFDVLKPWGKHRADVLKEYIQHLESRTVTMKQGEVLVTVAGFTGCGKSAIAGEIEIAMKAIGVPVTWANGDSEKRMTGADWLTAIEMYKPTVRIVEENIPRAAGIKVEAE
ncbi:ead/Ea22-like family protein [Klebsiella pneumoniae]|nr:ead/Ea22-like family protein [Klebsiella pneumoniae]MCQ0921524.1 ead/Ea22-like family protein [Klebsiella pneumoniae]